ncbi:zinc finger protein 692-like [Antennarius striatus]|uniref:zinc finger protein 692-like n=1 Tax=Antennarius striatus TaxID=241820 RepID=UPI0035B23CBE
MNDMGSKKNEISRTSSEFEATEDSTQAVKSSPDSTEPSRPRRGRVRPATRALTSADARSVIEGPARALRTRGAGIGRTPSLQGGRGTPARSAPGDTPVGRPEIKKSTPQAESKNTIATTASPKLSRPRKGKGGPLIPASDAPPTAMKPEAELEASPCEEETDLKGSNDKKNSMHQATLGESEVKKEESESEEDKNEKNREELVKKDEDGLGDKSQSSRKRSKQLQEAPRLPKRRKKPPVQYVRCEMEGCGTVLAHPRYLQHHIKYQHLLKKKYVCDHPSCGRLFRLQKQLLRHAKHHTDQRDYICEYCARAFKSSHNLAVHRMIHTGEKPIQCEICGFTCRQKASLNWHMKKHDAEASYQFSCSICSKRFEKKDSVVAHKAKSHPEVLIAEALAANGGSVISGPAPIAEPVPALAKPDMPSVSLKNQDVESGALAPAAQSQTQTAAAQEQFIQLPLHHVVQVEHQQYAPTLLHLSSAPPTHLHNVSHPQLVHISTIPTSNLTSDPQSTLLTLSTVTTLGPQPAAQWGKETREEEEEQPPGEGELWERVLVGDVGQDGEGMMWEGNRVRRKEDEGMEWERDGERQILLQCAEDPGDGLM